MTTDATSDPNDGVSVDGTGQNQSDVFEVRVMQPSHVEAAPKRHKCTVRSRRSSREKSSRPGRVRFADCRDDGGPGVGQSTH